MNGRAYYQCKRPYYYGYSDPEYVTFKRYEGTTWEFTGRIQYEYFTTEESKVFLEIKRMEAPEREVRYFWRFWKKNETLPAVYVYEWKNVDAFGFEETPEVTILKCGVDKPECEVDNT